ncbi:MAG TPA: Rpn family recombination-promoting nuclease/putative transposase, partial [Anaerolineae bacterium]|nr:Rpn family recombination-promoting nuclease/putative transposase [Anaerolineae bacterium]
MRRPWPETDVCRGTAVFPLSGEWLQASMCIRPSPGRDPPGSPNDCQICLKFDLLPRQSCYNRSMSDLTNPHDRFFKETFSRIEVARDLLANYLPPDVVNILDLDTLDTQPDSFVDVDLQEQFADLLYKVTLKDGRPAYIYVLLEHKSYPDPETPFQVLRYEMRIWENDWRNGEGLRPIIPLVLYHGRERWRAATDFGGLFAGDEALRPYWPQARYELLDLSGYSDEEVRGATYLQIGLLVMRYIFDPALRDHLADIFALFRDLAESQTALEYLRTVLYYMSQAAAHLQPKDMTTVIKGMLADEGSEIMQTVAEQWIEQGIEQGLQEA